MQTDADGFGRVQPWTPTPPIEEVWAASGRGVVSAELLENLPRPYGTHWLEGKAMYRPGWLFVATWHAPHWGCWTQTPVEVVPEPGVLELPQPVLDALRVYAMDWPADADLLHWHPRVGVPAITRIRHVTHLLDRWQRDQVRYPDERGKDYWTAPKMARAGLVASDPDPLVVAARVAAKWPALWGKYGCATDRPPLALIGPL